MSYSIRLLADEELNLANLLYHKVYGKHRQTSFFNWEFLEGPAGKAIYVGAFDGDKLIGTQSAIPIYFSGPDGSKILTAKSEDTLLDPEYRGKGLFDKMYSLLIDECKKAEICAIWGFTYARKPFLKIGFQIPFDSLSGVYVIHPFGSYQYLSSLNKQNQFKEKALITGMCAWSWMKGLLHTCKRSDTNITSGVFSENTYLESSILRAEDAFMIHEDMDYLNWRIKNNPYPNNYHELLIRNEENYVMASLTYNMREERIAYIEQLLFHPSLDMHAKMELIRHAIAVIRDSGKADIIRFWGFPGNRTNRTEIELLDKCGFFFVKKGTGFVYLPLGEKAPDAREILISRLYTQGNI